jgi:predicted RNA-binding protein with PIN domain
MNAPTPTQTYYIDGYNLIYQSDNLRNILHTDLEVARDKLVEQVIRWCATTGNKAHIIFDGQGKRLEQSPNHPVTNLVKILFTSKYKTADTIIERAVYKSKKKNSVIVVSADRGITDLCIGMGALIMNPQHFLTSIQDSQAEINRSIQKTQTKQISTLEDRMDTNILDHLRKIRDELDPH